MYKVKEKLTVVSSGVFDELSKAGHQLLSLRD